MCPAPRTRAGMASGGRAEEEEGRREAGGSFLLWALAASCLLLSGEALAFGGNSHQSGLPRHCTVAFLRQGFLCPTPPFCLGRRKAGRRRQNYNLVEHPPTPSMLVVVCAYLPNALCGDMTNVLFENIAGIPLYS